MLDVTGTMMVKLQFFFLTGILLEAIRKMDTYIVQKDYAITETDSKEVSLRKY